MTEPNPPQAHPVTVPPVCVDLFSGCGGLSTGLLDAGVAVKIGVDIDASSIETFNLNHGSRGGLGLVRDVRSLSGSQLREMAGGHVDLLAGGAPCQPFSIAGKRRALRDVRGDLIFEYVRLLSETAADAFIFENVPNLASVGGGAVLRQLLDAFGDAGYTASPSVLLAADYGVAQMRKRLFIVGARDRAIPFPPEPTHARKAVETLLGAVRPHVAVSEVLDDLPDVADPAAGDHQNHEPTFHGEAMLAAFRALQPGKRDPRSRHDRLHPDRPGFTLRAGTGNFTPLRPVHHRWDRVITVREGARLQSFEDTFVWPDTMPRLQQYRQLGNAVPPRLAAAVAQHVADHMEWSLAPGRFVVDAPPDSERIPLDERIRLRQRFMNGGAAIVVSSTLTAGV